MAYNRWDVSARVLERRTLVVVLLGLLLSGCATPATIQLAPGPEAVDLLRGTWTGDSSANAGTPFWLFVQEVSGSTVRGEEWGLQDPNRWERFTGTIESGELRIELREIRQTLVLRPFDAGDGTLELRGRTATSPPEETPIRLRRSR